MEIDTELLSITPFMNEITKISSKTMIFLKESENHDTVKELLQNSLRENQPTFTDLKKE